MQMKKRFWNTASVEMVAEGFSVRLDDRPLRTPGRKDFVVPTQQLAEYVASEWSAVGDEIDPLALPFTRLCNASIDSMSDKFADVVEMLTAYVETDLLCYRAESPSGLVMRQSQIWDPILGWIEETHGLALEKTQGILPISQSEDTVRRMRDWLEDHDVFSMMACHDLVLMSGSIVLTRAVCDGHLSASQAWEASRLDEEWQSEQWGADAEAEQAAEAKFKDFATASKMYLAVRS